MDSPKQGGSLHNFPKEIRDYIYEYVLLSNTYIHRGKPYPRPVTKKAIGSEVDHIVDLSILRTCKIIYSEAHGLLYSQGIFRIYVDFAHPPGDCLHTQGDIGKIKNLEIIINMTTSYKVQHFDPYTRDIEELPQSQAEILQGFTGTDVARKSCLVRFLSCGGHFHDYDVLNMPMFVEFKRFHGFETLLINVESLFHSTPSIIEAIKQSFLSDDFLEKYPLPQPTDELKQEDLKRWQWLMDTGEMVMDPPTAGSYHVEKSQARAFYKAVRAKLGSNIGPFAEGEVVKNNMSYCGQMTFHPRQDAIRRLQILENKRLAGDKRGEDKGYDNESWDAL